MEKHPSTLADKSPEESREIYHCQRMKNVLSQVGGHSHSPLVPPPIRPSPSRYGSLHLERDKRQLLSHKHLPGVQKVSLLSLSQGDATLDSPLDHCFDIFTSILLPAG